MPINIERPKVDYSSRATDACQLENEHLKGIIAAINLKVTKTVDLERELHSLRNAIQKSDNSQKELLETIDNQSQNLQDQMTKNEKFQSLIIEENNNLKNIILEKDH